MVVATLGRWLLVQQQLGTWEEERLKRRRRNVRADTGKPAQVSGVGRGGCSKGNLKGVAGREGGLEGVNAILLQGHLCIH